MYGYRYTPTSTVFPLPGLEIVDATAEVDQRRHKQTGAGNPATVELVEATGTGWRPVTQRAAQFREHAAELADTEHPDAGYTGTDVGRVLADLATLPRRTGRKRRPR